MNRITNQNFNHVLKSEGVFPRSTAFYHNDSLAIKISKVVFPIFILCYLLLSIKDAIDLVSSEKHFKRITSTEPAKNKPDQFISKYGTTIIAAGALVALGYAAYKFLPTQTNSPITPPPVLPKLSSRIRNPIKDQDIDWKIYSSLVVTTAALASTIICLSNSRLKKPSFRPVAPQDSLAALDAEFNASVHSLSQVRNNPIILDGIINTQVQLLATIIYETANVASKLSFTKVPIDRLNSQAAALSTTTIFTYSFLSNESRYSFLSTIIEAQRDLLSIITKAKIDFINNKKQIQRDFISDIIKAKKNFINGIIKAKAKRQAITMASETSSTTVDLSCPHVSFQSADSFNFGSISSLIQAQNNPVALNAELNSSDQDKASFDSSRFGLANSFPKTQDSSGILNDEFDSSTDSFSFGSNNPLIQAQNNLVALNAELNSSDQDKASFDPSRFGLANSFPQAQDNSITLNDKSKAPQDSLAALDAEFNASVHSLSQVRNNPIILDGIINTQVQFLATIIYKAASVASKLSFTKVPIDRLNSQAAALSTTTIFTYSFLSNESRYSFLSTIIEAQRDFLSIITKVKRDSIDNKEQVQIQKDFINDIIKAKAKRQAIIM